MDVNQLIEEVMARVATQLSETEPSAQKKAAEPQKPRWLVLTDPQGEGGPSLVEDPGLKAQYCLEAVSEDSGTAFGAYTGIILKGLRCSTMGQLAAGTGGSPYVETIMSAMLLGKRIVVPREGIQLFGVPQNERGPYWRIFEKQLEALKTLGLEVCDQVELMYCLGNEPQSPKGSEEIPKEIPEEKKVAAIEKHIITEVDIVKANREKPQIIYIPGNAILTDMAQEFIDDCEFSVERR
ncbi:hypothetical protein [Eubacterium barkeri]|uniref:Uncharacterized protein n=1 Tax=Eubacterium barkeri TaxID=1528 RepID=A0A1H3HZW5_EUBBA|nr:hypothetical protein [Eubacterium barkeri]SDY20912.1 hypothetical protein SAMN04488579_12023 [Eubacterium barkeri]